MPYHLLNIATGESFTCRDETWHSCLDLAEKEGWKPDGTLFDYKFILDESTDENDDIMYTLYMSLVVHHRFLEWDGNFTDRANQIVSHDDAHYLALNIRGLIDNRELIEFIAKGSFRICEI